MLCLQLQQYSLSVSGATSWLLLWITGFKILSIAVDGGSAMMINMKKISLLNFLTMLHFPCYPVERSKKEFPFYTRRGVGLSHTQCLYKLVTRICLFILLTITLSRYDVEQLFGKIILHMLYVLYIMLAVDINTSIGILISQKILAQPLMWGYDAPWQSESISDFWKNRWNTPTAMLLQQTVYIPIRTIAIHLITSRENGVKEKQVVKEYMAVIATFVVSGLMHQVALWFMCRHLDMSMMLFFLFQPLLIYMERVIFCNWHKQYGQSMIFRKVRKAATIICLFSLAHTLFFCGFERQKVDKLAIAEFQQFLVLFIKK
eukprot:TRINITY_DN2521_c0_g1_i2.p1 TRINITY_DN2521_c0_g1~~TRINITY_DN2521_c0_g1_i2.p1  ORF type:complete len:317 (-),score=1.23 TRINITY_DN2521_c0_g1_i2:346-1296(-)